MAIDYGNPAGGWTDHQIFNVRTNPLPLSFALRPNGQSSNEVPLNPPEAKILKPAR